MLIVDVRLDPGHEMLNILWCCHLGWLFEVLAVLPKILKPIPVSTLDTNFLIKVVLLVCGLHLGAALGRTKFGYGAVKKVDLVIEIDHCI